MSKHQRRKGNVKAASSSQAAELLANSGYAVPLMTFDSVEGFSVNAVENIDVNEPIRPELRNALRKLTKKEIATRCRGINDLLAAVETADIEDLEKSFTTYASIYPRLALDGTSLIRTVCIRVLGCYINELQKNSERHLKKVLPYVVLSLCDTSSAVAQEADSLLKKCFVHGKDQKVKEIFLQPACEIALQLILRVHPLLSKGDDEEYERLRFSALATQSCNYLIRVLPHLSGDADRTKVLGLFDRQSLQKLGSQSRTILAEIFVLAQHASNLGWKGVVESGVTMKALSFLDDSNRSVCRAAANFIIEIAKTKALFNIANPDKVISRISGIIRKKDSRWNQLSLYLIPLTESVCSTKTPSEGRELLLRMIDEFFNGLPWQPAFPVLVYMQNLCEVIKFSIDYASLNLPGDKLFVIELFEQLWKGIKLSMTWIRQEDWLESGIIGCLQDSFFKPSRSISQELAERFKEILCENLLESLPASAVLVSCLWGIAIDTNLANFAAQLLCHGSTSQTFVVSILEKCSPNVMKDIAMSDDYLGVLLSTKLDWSDESAALRLLNSLAVFALKTGKPIGELYQLRDALSCARFVMALSLTKDWTVANELLGDKIWQETLLSAIDFFMDEPGTVKLTESVLDAITSVSDPDVIVISMLNKPGYRLTDMLKCLKIIGSKLAKNVREMALETIVERLFDDTLSAEVIESTVDALSCCDTDMTDLVHNLLKSRLSDLSFMEENIAVLSALAAKVPSSSMESFLISEVELYECFAALDEQYCLDILGKCEFLGLLAVENLLSSSSSELSLEKCINRSVFLFDYLQRKKDVNLDAESVHFTYIFACSIYLVTQCTSTNRKELPLHLIEPLIALLRMFIDEQRERKQQVLVTVLTLLKSRPSLCLLLSSRYLKNDGDLYSAEITESLNALSEEQHYPVVLAALQFQEESIVESAPITDEEWVNALELCSSLCDADKCMDMLSKFYIEHDTTFEDDLFANAENGDPSFSALSCALLRLMWHCSPSLFDMDPKIRDYLCVRMIAIIESTTQLKINDTPKSRSFYLYINFAIRLYVRCTKIVKKKAADRVSVEFVEEWEHFYASADNLLVGLFLEPKFLFMDVLPRNALALSMHYISDNAAQDVVLTPRVDAELDAVECGQQLQSFVIPVMELLSDSTAPDVQLAALKLLKSVTHEILELENKKENEESEEIMDARKKRLPTIFTRAMEMKPVSALQINPSWLVWDALITALGQFDIAERVAYSYSISSQLCSLITDLFIKVQGSEQESFTFYEDNNWWLLDFSAEDHQSKVFHLVERYAFDLLYRICAAFPAMVRQWYTNLPKSATVVINPFVTKHISPLIWRNECDRFQTSELPQRLKVRLLRPARQIVAEYEASDWLMQLTVEFPADFPLSVPIIDMNKAIGDRDMKRTRLLQLTRFLAHQNGAAVDAVLMWARNIERHLDGADDCVICMMTVHTRTYQLPRVRCKQCKKRFHSHCLYKWFETSSNSTCPLCRASFRS